MNLPCLSGACPMFRNLNLAEHLCSQGKPPRLTFRKVVPNKKTQMGEIYGYARVSTEDQELGLQVSALRAAGVPDTNIVQETASGKAGAERPLYAALLARLEDGDRLVVWKVDRLGRSTLDALNTAKDLDARGVHIVITTLGIDLKTPGGRLVFGVMAQIAELARADP